MNALLKPRTIPNIAFEVSRRDALEYVRDWEAQGYRIDEDDQSELVDETYTEHYSPVCGSFLGETCHQTYNTYKAWYLVWQDDDGYHTSVCIAWIDGQKAMVRV